MEDGAVPVGKTIKRWRRYRDMTQEDLGTAASLHAGTISRVERSAHKPDLRTLERIAAVVGTTAAALLAGDLPPDRHPNDEAAPAGRAVS